MREAPELAGPDLLSQLAALLAAPVPLALRARTAERVLDWAACALAGLDTPAGRAHAAAAAAHGAGPCTALGGVGPGPRRLAAPGAILANAAPANVLEMDDIHRESVLHPGPVVVPAALAAAEEAGADAGALLDAVVRGYEAMIRVGRALGPAHYATWHPTSTCGPFGAAAACASVRGLDREATAHALRLAGTQASGPWQTRHGPVNEAKQLHAARAAHAGWLAAALAAAGATGPDRMLEGPQGFFVAFCPSGVPTQAEQARVVAPGDGWLIEETGFKPWPACRHTHAVIDAALALRARGVEPLRVRALHLETYAAALAMCDDPLPTTPHAARFSLQHCAAVALLDGPPDLSAFEMPTVIRPDVAALRARVRVALDPVRGSEHPARFSARLRAEWPGDGGTGAEADVPDALGDPANPLPPGALERKARMLLAAAGHADPDGLIAAALALADGAPLHCFTGQLAATAAATAAPHPSPARLPIPRPEAA